MKWDEDGTCPKVSVRCPAKCLFLSGHQPHFVLRWGSHRLKDCSCYETRWFPLILLPLALLCLNLPSSYSWSIYSEPGTELGALHICNPLVLQKFSALVSYLHFTDEEAGKASPSTFPSPLPSLFSSPHIFSTLPLLPQSPLSPPHSFDLLGLKAQSFSIALPPVLAFTSLHFSKIGGVCSIFLGLLSQSTTHGEA